MAVAEGDVDAALELLADLGDLTTRRMMGGLCIYHDGTIFAILHSDGGLHLKARGQMIDRLEAMGARQWTYQRDGQPKPTGMPYWSMPEAALDDPDLACELARETLKEL